MISASYSAHEEIEKLLERVETAEADPRRTMRAFSVKHRRVDEMLSLLESLLEGAPLPSTEPEAAKPAEAALLPVDQPKATGGRLPRPPSKLEISLSLDEGTNRILAIGPPRGLDDLARLIEQLDQQEPQVLVETLIVTLTESQTRDLAVELQKIGEEDGALYSLASLFSAGSPNPSSNTLPAAAGTGLGAVVLDPRSFSGVLHALETLNRGRSLTVPKLLVNNHETAHLDSVLQQPFATSNTSTNLATISFGGTLDAGTSVQVTPQITDGDQLLVEYAVSLSTFVGDSADPTLPPPRQENKLESVATVPDGYTVVVGGLEVETDTHAESRVPILGAIPLVGNLFKSRSATRTKSRFFVFLRCSVLRDARYEDLRYLSAVPMALASVEDGLPVVEPRVIR